MRRNETDGDTQDDFGGDLTGAQQTAMLALVRGATVVSAAEEAGVSRSTLHRWLTDPLFVSAYNRARADVRDAALRRASSLADRALSVVEKALDDGDAKTALALLRGLGLLTGEAATIGPVDPRTIELDRRQREASRRTDETLVALAESLAY